MANTRFKTENSLYVTGSTNSQIDTASLFNANVTVNSAVLVVNGEIVVGNNALGGTSNLTVTGNLLVAGNLQYTNTNVTGDLRADVDGIDLGNTSNRFDIFILDGRVYSSFNPASNSVGTTLGNTTARWVITGNTISLSSSITASGNVTINTDAFKVDASSKQVSINTASYSKALNVSGGADVTGDVAVSANLSANTVRAGNSYIVTNTATVSSSSATVVDEFANSGMKMVKYLAYSRNDTVVSRYGVEIVALNANTTILVHQYGEVNNATLGTFNVIKTGANVQLTYTNPSASGANTDTITVIRTVML